ncbi:hypothetical protein PIB30_029686 [Stylosanthes scabra]|uniref:Uncharacterized protein n=1 Tax=Stylosanthes scabra TaxID=79078 RepID=A0ABU6V9D8_9FABA|nr:hypothetical protein [Stylosanthes scabra]
MENLISSSQFANEHVRRLIAADPSLSDPRVAYNHPYLLYRYKRFGDFSVRSLLENPAEPTKVVRFEGRLSHYSIGSCNGLLCLLESVGMKSRVMLWNPCTGLASPSLEIRDIQQEFIHFARTLPGEPFKIFQVTAYLATVEGYSCLAPLLLTGFVCMTLLWIAFVLSLDLVKESFSEFSLPHKNLVHETILQELCVLRNCLAVCFKHWETGWSVWLMQEYGVTQSWTKLAVIPYHPRLSGVHLRPLCVWEMMLLWRLHHLQRWFCITLMMAALTFLSLTAPYWNLLGMIYYWNRPFLFIMKA